MFDPTGCRSERPLRPPAQLVKWAGFAATGAGPLVTVGGFDIIFLIDAKRYCRFSVIIDFPAAGVLFFARHCAAEGYE